MRFLIFTVAAALMITANAWAKADACCKDGTPTVAAAPDQAPAREYAKVTFRDPVKVGDRVLMGTYIIEHDNDRMASGGPCTHIYNINDRRTPVVTFHCRHLHRDPRPQATVTLRRMPDMAGRGFKLVEFGFAGSAEGHGVPGVR